MASPPARELELAALLGPAPNPRGVPEMRFLESISDLLVKYNTNVESALAALQTMHSKYKLMEQSLAETKKRLRVQLPDLQASLDAVNMLIARAAEDADASFPVHFALADQVHARANVKPSGVVSLWLGAKIMLEYTYAEAKELLESHIVKAQAKLDEVTEDLDFVRGQAITTEVNMARVFNHDVVVRRESKRGGGAAAEGGAVRAT